MTGVTRRIRVGLAVTFLLGVIYGFSGLMSSVAEFLTGMGVALAALLGYGLLDFIEARRDERLHRTRVEVPAQSRRLRPPADGG